MKTNFNVTGYSYDYDEETRILTIEEGFLKKETYDLDAMENHSIRIIGDVIFPINDAGRLWKINIYIIPLFIAVLFGLFYSSKRQEKDFKRYMTVYILLVALFIIWDIMAYSTLFEDLIRLSDYTNSLKG